MGFVWMFLKFLFNLPHKAVQKSTCTSNSNNVDWYLFSLIKLEEA